MTDQAADLAVGYPGPVPGEAWTSPPGAMPFDRPPEINTAEEACAACWAELTQTDYGKMVLIISEAPNDARTIAQLYMMKGFVTGKWTVDLMVICAPAIHAMHYAYAKLGGVDVQMNPVGFVEDPNLVATAAMMAKAKMAGAAPNPFSQKPAPTPEPIPPEIPAAPAAEFSLPETG